MGCIFSKDFGTKKTHIVTPGEKIEKVAKVISSNVSDKVKENGDKFANEITSKFVTDFEKTESDFNAGKVNVVDKMVHVSTFMVIDDIVYMTYYANTATAD